MKLFLLILLISFQAQASFENTSKRYLMPGDFYNKLILLFPNGYRPFYSYSLEKGFNQYDMLDIKQCFRPFQDESKHPFQVYGIISPVTGEAESSQPDINTVNQLLKCGGNLIKSEIELLTLDPSFDFVIESDLSSPAGLARDTLNRLFPYFKKQIISEGYKIRGVPVLANDPKIFEHTVHLVHYMLGPNVVIQEFGVAASAEQIASDYIAELALMNQKKSMNLYDYTIWVLKNLIIRDEFLSY